MKLFNKVGLMLALIVIALVAAACGGGGGSGSATDAAKSFMEAVFKADANAMRNVTCDAQKGQITDDMVSNLREGLAQMGQNVDISGLTYTYDSSTKMVKIGGNIKATVQGVSVDVPIASMFPEFPVVEEGGGWKVCPQT